LENKSGPSSAGGGRFGHMDDYSGDSFRYNTSDRSSNNDRYDNDRYDSGRYDNDRYENNTSRGNDDTYRRDTSDDFNNTPRSFSRAAVRSLAKTGGYSEGGGRQRGSSFNSSVRDDYDSPRQITASVSSPQYSRDLVIASHNENNERRARALFNFAGEQDGDLPFHKGEIITIVKKTNTQNDWWTGKLNNREGIVSFVYKKKEKKY
jgi:hypothetical protein